MEETFLKQQELHELKMNNANAYQAKNEIQKQVVHKHAQMD
jgi:hypothetical protein